MSRRCLDRIARSVWLLLLLPLGGGAGCSVWSLVIPEQRHLDIRSPSQIHGPPIPLVAPPTTVSEKPPADAPKELSLDEAIRIALDNSSVVRILTGVTATASGQTIYDAAISNTAIDDARAAFDPTITVKNNWNRLEPPTALLDPTNPTGASIPPFRDDQYDVNVALQKKTITGGTFSLNADYNRSRFRPGLFPLNPSLQSTASLSYTQPLLRGAGIAANVAPIVIARINTEVSFFQYRDSVQEMVRGVVEAYWAVVFARTDAWAKRQQVEQGQAAYERAEARQRAGFGNRAEVAQAKVAVSNFKANLVGAEASVLQREAALRNILRLPPTVPPQLVLTTPPTPVRVEPRWEEILKLASERRPDLIELKLIIEADQQSWIQANNLARPQVDLVGFYQWNGLEGETPSGAHIGTSAGEFANWTLGVNFSVPLGLRQDRARLRRTELVLVRDHANLEQGIHNAVHLLAGNVRNLAQYYEQYQAFKQTRAAARENLEQQLADFRAGRAIYLNVLQAISDWGNSISSEAQALAQYNTELANLERQTGSILETHGVRFAEERYRAIGPLGRCFEPKLYPAATPPTPNADRYPIGTEPAEKALEQERPAIPGQSPHPEKGPALPELPAPRPLFLAPVIPTKG